MLQMPPAPRDRGPGTVVVSVDAELGWGFHDLADPPRDRLTYARTGWLRLLELFDEYNVPATWALVGHLFLEDCDREHADHPAPPGWFDRERTDWADCPSLRFSRGLIDRVEDAAVDHELANHSFSHVLFGDDATTPAVARAELAAAERAAGRSFDSFVFPRNSVGHRDALADAGYACYRGRKPTAARSAVAESTRKVTDAVAGVSPPVVEPTVDEYGLVNVPASLYLYGFEGVARAVVELVGEDPVVASARRGVDAAARTGGLFHLWLHPNNLRYERHARRLRAVLEYVAARRAGGDVRVEPMGAVAARALAERGDADVERAPARACQ